MPPVPPKPQRLVNDYAGILAPQNIEALERKLVAYDDSTSTEIAIVIERLLPDGTAFDRSYEIAKAWGVGGGENDNGVLIYVAVDNREVFIQNGYGVEDRLTDALTRRIIEQVIVPNFRTGAYYQAFDRATSVMIELLQGRYEATESESVGGGLSPLMLLLILVITIVVIRWLASRGGDGGDDDDGGYNREGRYRGPSRSRGGWMVLPGGGFGGGGFGGGGGGFGGGGGGGGFGGFGGGGFGGGGAGGSW